MFQPDEGRLWLGMVLKVENRISDSEKLFDIAYTNSIIGTVILLTKKKLYRNRQKGKVTYIAEIKYVLSMQ